MEANTRSVTNMPLTLQSFLISFSMDVPSTPSSSPSATRHLSSPPSQPPSHVSRDRKWPASGTSTCSTLTATTVLDTRSLPPSAWLTPRRPIASDGSTPSRSEMAAATMAKGTAALGHRVRRPHPCDEAVVTGTYIVFVVVVVEFCLGLWWV